MTGVWCPRPSRSIRVLTAGQQLPTADQGNLTWYPVRPMTAPAIIGHYSAGAGGCGVRFADRGAVSDGATVQGPDPSSHPALWCSYGAGDVREKALLWSSWPSQSGESAGMRTRPPVLCPASAVAGFRCPPDVIGLAVRGRVLQQSFLQLVGGPGGQTVAPVASEHTVLVVAEDDWIGRCSGDSS
jgi:hypothetical protein